MINTYDVLETIRMIQDDCLDIRTITMGISLLDCIDSDINVACENVYKKITAKAARLVEVGEQIEKELGIPIINKRISVTPIAIVSAACKCSPVPFAHAMDRAAKDVGVNLIGGYTALVPKGRRYRAYQVYPRGTCYYRESMFLCKYRFNKNRYQSGRLQNDGWRCKRVCRKNS